MTRMQELPVETIQAICSHLRNETKERHHLVSVVETCSFMYACAAPILWSELAFVCTDSHTTATYMSMLSEMLSNRTATGSQPHPGRHAKKLSIDFPAFAIPGPLSKQCTHLASSVLSEFLAYLPRLVHLELDLCMAVCEPRQLLHQIFCGSRVARSTLDTSPYADLQVLSLVGLYRTILPISQPQPHLRRLKLGLTCCHTRLDLALFPNLTHLHLEMDCRDSDAHDFRVTPIPSTLWSSLQTLVLECPGGELNSGDVLDMLETSLSVSCNSPLRLSVFCTGSMAQYRHQAASTVSLEAIGIFWALDASEYSRFLRLLQRFAPFVARLAWVLPTIPMPADIEMLSQHMPRLQELTLCAYMHLGAWLWTEPADKYAAAFSRLPDLRVLAINHYLVEPELSHVLLDSATDSDMSAEVYFPGKFTLECSEAAKRDRFAFADTATKASSRLEAIVFCPAEQEDSIITVGSRAAHDDVLLFWERL